MARASWGGNLTDGEAVLENRLRSLPQTQRDLDAVSLLSVSGGPGHSLVGWSRRCYLPLCSCFDSTAPDAVSHTERKNAPGLKGACHSPGQTDTQYPERWGGEDGCLAVHIQTHLCPSLQSLPSSPRSPGRALRPFGHPSRMSQLHASPPPVVSPVPLASPASHPHTGPSPRPFLILTADTLLLPSLHDVPS